MQNWKPGELVKILSIDGGGIRGIIPARLLADIERRTKKPIADLFHLLAGTSTGGIIACGLGVHMTAAEVVDLYEKRGSEIFPHNPWQELRNKIDLTEPRYSPDRLEKILADVFGHKTLADI